MPTARIILVEKVAGELVRRLAAKAAALPHGKPTGQVVPGSAVPASVVDDDTIGRIEAPVDPAVGMGARPVTGGVRRGSTIMPATPVDHATAAMRLFPDESFGPVVCGVRARDTDHAVERAGDTSCGLSAAVFGSDITRTPDAAERSRGGICRIDGPGGVRRAAEALRRAARQRPWPGGSREIDAFTATRRLTAEQPKQGYPFRARRPVSPRRKARRSAGRS